MTHDPIPASLAKSLPDDTDLPFVSIRCGDDPLIEPNWRDATALIGNLTRTLTDTEATRDAAQAENTRLTLENRALREQTTTATEMLALERERSRALMTEKGDASRRADEAAHVALDLTASNKRLQILNAELMEKLSTSRALNHSRGLALQAKSDRVASLTAAVEEARALAERCQLEIAQVRAEPKSYVVRVTPNDIAPNDIAPSAQGDGDPGVRYCTNCGSGLLCFRADWNDHVCMRCSSTATEKL
jgi:hypothetical protein